jgi:hypothetical protein
VVAVVIFVFMLARLLAAASPSADGTDLVTPGGGQASAPYHYYYAPVGPGSDTDSP